MLGPVGHLASAAALPEVCPQVKSSISISPTSPSGLNVGWTVAAGRPPDSIPMIKVGSHSDPGIVRATTPGQACLPLSGAGTLDIPGSLVRPPENHPCDFEDSEWESLGPLALLTRMPYSSIFFRPMTRAPTSLTFA